MSHHRVPFRLQIYEKSINSRCVLDMVSKVVSIKRGGLCLSRNELGFSNISLSFRWKPYLERILSCSIFHKHEAQQVLDDDSSKIFFFFTSSVFSLSEHNMTFSHRYKVAELQLLQKGVVKSWLGPLSETKF